MVEGILNDLTTNIKVSEKELLDLINTRYMDFHNDEITLGDYLLTIEKFKHHLEMNYND